MIAGAPLDRFVLASVLGAAFVACKNPSDVSPAARADADAIFTQRCGPCHGEAGAGDGSASKDLHPPPRSFQEKSLQSSVSDEHIERIIKLGGAAVGKSNAMPPNPDLHAKPEVVTALREHIRRLSK